MIDCVKAHKILPEADYIVAGDQSTGQSNAPAQAIAHHNPQLSSSDPPIDISVFHKCQFYLHPPFIAANCPSRTDMTQIIQCAGGTIDKRRPTILPASLADNADEPNHHHYYIVCDEKARTTDEMWLQPWRSKNLVVTWEWVLRCVSMGTWIDPNDKF